LVDSSASQAANPRRLRRAIFAGLAFAAVVMAICLAVDPINRGWFAPLDFWLIFRASHYVANGALGYLYESTDYVYALPLFPIVLAPVAFFSEAMKLSERIPFALHHPTAWLIAGPYCITLASAATYYASRALADRLRLAGSLATDIAPLFLVVAPAVLLGHFEDALAVAFLLLALRSFLNQKYDRAALMLSVAIAFKQWGVLAIPLFLVLVPPRSRIRSLVLISALPVALAALPLAVDWKHASHALFSSPTFPYVGHAAPWLDPDARLVTTSFYRVAMFAAAVAVAWRLRRESSESRILAGFAIVFLARALLEPVPMMYYLTPALGLLSLYEGMTTGRRLKTFLIGLPLLAWFLIWPTQLLWWSIFASGATALAVPPLRDLISVPKRSELEVAPALAPSTAFPPG
jgi:hypothetical protein